MALQDRLKEARKRMGLSQLEVAKEVGISNAALSNYEIGYREPDLETLKRLAKFYRISMDELAEMTPVEEAPIYDLGSIVKSSRISLKGREYQLSEGQRRSLRRQLGKLMKRYENEDEE